MPRDLLKVQTGPRQSMGPVKALERRIQALHERVEALENQLHAIQNPPKPRDQRKLTVKHLGFGKYDLVDAAGDRMQFGTNDQPLTKQGAHHIASAWRDGMGADEARALVAEARAMKKAA